MPKALAYLIEKVEELNRKLESLGDISASGKDVWMWGLISHKKK